MQFPSTDGFLVREVSVADEPLYLVYPRLQSTEWTPETLKFRSSVWTKDGILVSAGFKKFFYHGEKPGLYPVFPTDLGNVSCVEKIDGSCLIVSKYKGHPIIRTRRCFDATTHEESGSDIEFFRQKYPKAFDNDVLDGGYSLIYEWTTPSFRIVIDYGEEPQLTLLGAIHHSDYEMVDQNGVDELSQVLGIPRPRRYTFDSLEHMIESVKAFEDKEGICAYYNHDQNIVKIKGLRYLTVHAFLSKCSTKTLFDLYLEHGSPSYEELESYITRGFDYECAVFAKPYLDELYDGVAELNTRIRDAKHLIEKWKSRPRRDFAKFLNENYPKHVPTLVFFFMDHPDEELSGNMLRQSLKKCLPNG